MEIMYTLPGCKFETANRATGAVKFARISYGHDGEHSDSDSDSKTKKKYENCFISYDEW